MPQKKNNKIFIYLLLFFIIGTINNKNLNKIYFTNINKITVSGLDKKNNFELLNKLNFLKVSNLFFLDQKKIIEIMNANNLVNDYSVYKQYPSTINIKIEKTVFLAQLKKKNNLFFLGSNGKLIKTDIIQKEIPYIFGEFKLQNFFELKKAIDETNFDYQGVKNLFFFKLGRWDIEMSNGILIRLPKDKIKDSLQIVTDILSKDQQKLINYVDLRQHNQVVINGK
jgi:cell division septal protein FtsQ